MSASIEFPLSNGYTALIDAEDLAKISRWHWHGRFCKPSIYAARTARRTVNGIRKVVNIYMHRFLLDAPAGMQVDHLNSDTLDNRRSNLELVTAEENMARRWKRD